MGSVARMPVRLRHQICRDRMAASHIEVDKVRCPRVGECLCIPERTQLVMAVERAQAALEAYDYNERRPQ